MREALVVHDGIVRGVVAAHGGWVFSTGGDGFAIAFQRAGDGVRAAIHAQRRLRAYRWPDECELRVRMGLHSGEVDERDGDYFGSPVNRAARIMSAAEAGHIVVSAVTASLAGSNAEFSFVDVGVHHLKSVVSPIRLFCVVADGLPLDRRPISTSVDVPGNLLRPVTEFVGRVAILQQRAAALPGQRLVTLVGPGGVGKTRLATEVAGLLVNEFPDGIWLAELAPVGDEQAIVSLLAMLLGIAVVPGLSVLSSLVEWLRDRRVLLIVDNCEHVLGAVAPIIRTIVAECPKVTVLATSREPVGVAGERVVSVPSLERDAAIELFFERANAADDRTVFSDSERAVVGSICERLDGIPLAIELAAARTRSLSLTDIAHRLDDRFRLLRGTGRSGLERHETLRAAVAWSYRLLAPTGAAVV